jgi:hypothetical protein
MLLNIFTYKGPANSLLSPWISCGYSIDLKHTSQNLEKLIPGSRYLFSYRKNLDKFEDLLLGASINIRTIDSYAINTLGDLAVYNSHKQLKAGAYSILREDDILMVNYININNTLLWYERLCIIYSVFIRHQYLQRTSNKKINLFNLDHNLNAHLNLLETYKYLPPYYIVDKCLNNFSNVQPKPFWFKREIDFINNNINK